MNNKIVSHQGESNPRPAIYETAALTIWAKVAERFKVGDKFENEEGKCEDVEMSQFENEGIWKFENEEGKCENVEMWKCGNERIWKCGSGSKLLICV